MTGIRYPNAHQSLTLFKRLVNSFSTGKMRSSTLIQVSLSATSIRDLNVKMTDDQHNHWNVDFGVSLDCATALEQDILSRLGFAEVAVSVLRNVRSSAGVVLAIEGGLGEAVRAQHWQ